MIKRKSRNEVKNTNDEQGHENDEELERVFDNRHIR